MKIKQHIYRIDARRMPEGNRVRFEPMGREVVAVEAKKDGNGHIEWVDIIYEVDDSLAKLID